MHRRPYSLDVDETLKHPGITGFAIVITAPNDGPIMVEYWATRWRARLLRRLRGR